MLLITFATFDTKETYEEKSKCGILVCLAQQSFHVIVDILIMTFSFQFSIQSDFLVNLNYTFEFNEVQFQCQHFVFLTCYKIDTAQKMKFSIKDFFRKCNQTGNGNSLMENLIFCVVSSNNSRSFAYLCVMTFNFSYFN